MQQMQERLSSRCHRLSSTIRDRLTPEITGCKDDMPTCPWRPIPLIENHLCLGRQGGTETTIGSKPKPNLRAPLAVGFIDLLALFNLFVTSIALLGVPYSYGSALCCLYTLFPLIPHRVRILESLLNRLSEATPFRLFHNQCL